MPNELPAIVIVGRPNVGKSTLFNRITGQRRAIVGDEPGITRDRLHGKAVYERRRFELIDTGGIVVDDADYIPSQILKQAKFALDKAISVVFVVDGRSELTAADRELAQLLRKTGKPVTLAVNKADTGPRQDLAHDFYTFGFKDIFPVSGEHGLGVDQLLEHLTKDIPEDPQEEEEEDDDNPETEGVSADGEPGEGESEKTEAEIEADKPYIRVAIIGRPNAGKSTLLNSLTGEDRAIVSPVAGTTRDSVDEEIENHGVRFVFIDTAGIRRKGKTKLMAEKMSVVMARRNIRMADVVIVVMDASEGVLGLDATIAGYAHEGGRSVILCVNKWDLIDSRKKGEFEENLRYHIKFLEYAPSVYLSAKTGASVTHLFGMIRECYDNARKRVTTGQLNRFVETLRFEERKILYITQAGVKPPSFILFTDKAGPLHFSDERYIINQLRKRFGFEGTPIELKIRGRLRKKDRPSLK
ncbi:MAG: small GTP-binding protein [Bryobacterales bacterium]|nr:small GTP-binding protein [Bryobacterales bacterium]